MTLFAMLLFMVWAPAALSLFVGGVFLTPAVAPCAMPPGRRPAVSVIFAYRDEPEIERTVRLMLLQEDVDLEVIAVDDRSRPGSGLKSEDPHLKKSRVDRLPAGWLGKTHALWQGYRQSRGEWLLFTDADVVFHPRAAVSAIAEAERRRLDHLTLFPRLLRRGILERAFTDAFMVNFNLYFRPWAARFGFWPDFAGIGAFNLVRRAAYERAGTHERIAFDVGDDMALGKVLKRSGARQMAASGHLLTAVRWVDGFAGVVNSLRKNAFAGLKYSLPFTVLATVAQLALNLAPFVLLFFPEPRAWAAGSVAMISVCYAAALKFDRTALLGFPAHPFSCLLFLYVVWVSAVTTLRDGGVTWRDTFYPLDELRRRNSL